MTLFNISVTNRRAKKLRFHQETSLGHYLLPPSYSGENADHALRGVAGLNGAHDEMVQSRTHEDRVLPIHLLHGVLWHEECRLLRAHLQFGSGQHLWAQAPTFIAELYADLHLTCCGIKALAEVGNRAGEGFSRRIG